MAPYTRPRIGGVVEFFAEPTSADELIGLIKRFVEDGRPIRLLGGGSNILVRDEGVAGLVIALTAPVFCTIEPLGEGRVQVGSGTRLSHLISTAAREGWSGPEALVGIPGSVGGALHENSGQQGSDIGTWVRAADVITRKGDVIQRSENDLQFAYRASSLNELVILKATFQFEQDDPNLLTKKMQKNWIVTKSRQPGIDENTAYVFRDHGGESASTLIERAGLKGTRIGGVEVANRDPNFFITQAGASSDDFLRLIDLVKDQVRERLDVELQTGLNIW